MSHWVHLNSLLKCICVFVCVCIIYYIYIHVSVLFSLFLLLCSVRLFNVVTNLFSTFLDPLIMNLIQKGTGHKHYIKLLVDTNITAKTIQCLRRKLGVNLCYLVLGDLFLRYDAKSANNKRRTDKLHFSKNKNSCAAINTIKNLKGSPHK